MKKTVKSLIIAASVAAVAGIGAVSFAAWQGGNTVNSTASNGINNGAVTVNGGFLLSGDATSVTMSLADATKNELMPYDQGSVTGAQTTTLVFNVPDFQVENGQTYTLTLTTSADTTIDFKYQVGDAAVAAPANATAYATWGTASGTALGGVAVTETATITGKKLTVIMDSTDLNDMGVEVVYTLTFASQATA